MLLAKTLRSSTYRFALVAIGVFGAVVIALFAYVRWSTAGYVRSVADNSIAVDLASLAQAQEAGGREALIDAIERQSGDPHFRDAVYLLADPSFRRLAGNLGQWPSRAKRANGWADIAPATASPALRFQYVTLPNGDHLLVGQKAVSLDRFVHEIDGALGSALALVFIIAAVASISITRRTVGRIETINAISRRIMQSGLDKRIPLRGSDDEWDELAENLNSMLERIRLLMVEVKQATDNVAHDLRTPLARMRARLEKASAQDREQQRDQLLIDGMIVDLEGVLRMFSSLIRISQIETCNVSRSFRRADLAQIADDVVELFDAAAEKKNVRLRREGDHEASVRGDRDLLFDALANIVDNALKYVREGGLVCVETRQATSGATVCVSDNGPGIPESERERVFRRFYRLDWSRGSEGNGLGLSLVSAVARLHGATITLSDNAPGLRFQLEFPPPERLAETPPLRREGLL